MATSNMVTAQAGKTWLGHPRGLFLLFFAEMWERFSYYGMRAILIFYLTKHFLFGEDRAYLLYGAYTSLVYITPVIGGYLADRFGFRVVGAVIPGGTTLAAPSASDLADLVSAIDEAGVRTIFAESSQPDRLMKALAEEADVEVTVTELFTESLTDVAGGAPDYLTMMRVNTERIATGLSP